MKKPGRSPRVRERPNPEMWAFDEIIFLPEAAELMFPKGPLTVSSLRTAVRDGKLAVSVIAGKHFTTRRQILGLGACAPLPAPPS